MLDPLKYSCGLEKELLYRILPAVSRSFYLSLRVAPTKVRRSLGLGYLFCRAADTMADTEILPPELRTHYLTRFREAFEHGGGHFCSELRQNMNDQNSPSAEHRLLQNLDACFMYFDGLERDERKHIRNLVLTLTQGMEMDLRLFHSRADGDITALQTMDELEKYMYLVAGCVGEFWTRLALEYLPALGQCDAQEMIGRSVRFGKGLQLTNILRDIPADLRIGRCYLPREELARFGIEPEALLRRDTISTLRPFLDELHQRARNYFEDAWLYTAAIPVREWRMRLSCAWPLLIGAGTLRIVQKSPNLLEPQTQLKIPRSRIYTILLGSLATVWSNRGLALQYKWLSS